MLPAATFLPLWSDAGHLSPRRATNFMLVVSGSTIEIEIRMAGNPRDARRCPWFAWSNAPPRHARPKPPESIWWLAALTALSNGSLPCESAAPASLHPLRSPHRGHARDAAHFGHLCRAQPLLAVLVGGTRRG